MKKILFISHDATRTGAPMVLLHFLRWLKVNQADIQVDLLALKGGVLETEFIKNCDIFYNYSQKVKPTKLKLWERVLLKLGWFKKPDLKEKMILHLIQNDYDVVYANTILSIPLAYEVVTNSTNIKFIVHIHELNSVIKQLLPDLSVYKDVIDYFITPAKIVKDNLVNNWELLESRVKVIYECASVNNIINKEKSQDFFTIGASGTVIWRKGYDVFIQVARQLCNLYDENNFKFVWVGSIKPHDLVEIEEDLLKLGLKDKVFFTGEVENPSLYYNDFDLFVMTSREDPFPLVCIEVGMLGKPIISFDKATGTNEFLEKGGGFVVPYLDINAMVEKIITYYNDSKLLFEDGVYNQKVFSQFTPDIVCPQLFELINQE